jgi:hypothetical protein
VRTITELTESLEEARRATRAAPASSAAWYLRGVAAYETALKRPDRMQALLLESRFSLLKAVGIPERSVPANAYFVLAEAEAELGDRKTAMRYLRTCLARDPGYEPAQKLLAEWLDY